MAKKSAHYWRIHARVCKRVFTDLSQDVRDIITHDVEHTSETYKWFEDKVHQDTMRLYEDGTYYDNDRFSFRFSANE